MITGHLEVEDTLMREEDHPMKEGIPTETEDIQDKEDHKTNLNLFICYSPILTRHFGGALHMVIGSGQPAVSNQFEGEPPPPISTPWGIYRGATSYSALTLLSHLPSSPASGLSWKSYKPLWLGANLMVRRWSLMCANHIDMIAHTPSLFYQVGYHSYICGVQHSWAKSRIILWTNAGRAVTHPCINQAHDCLTSVIKPKTFAPCYVSPHDTHEDNGRTPNRYGGHSSGGRSPDGGGPPDGGRPPDDGGPPDRNGGPPGCPNRRGPPGPRGPLGPIRPVIEQQPQVVLDTTTLENTFENMGQSMLQLARVQDQTNHHLQQYIQQGQLNLQAHSSALHQLANSTHQRNYDHIFASIPIYDGSNREEFFPWLDQLEAACYYCGRDIKTEALGRSAGPV